MSSRHLIFPLALATALLATPSAHAQQSLGGTPPGHWANLAPVSAWETLEVPDLAAIRAEDALPGKRPLRYGVVLSAEFDLARDGQWDRVEGGSVWRLGLVSPGAFSLGLEFEAFDLPAGAQLFLNGASSGHVLGAYTQRNERPDGGFAIEPLVGDRAVLELFVPEWADEAPRLAVSRLVHDYRDVFALERSGPAAAYLSDGGDGGCSIDAACSPGDPYELEKRMAVRTLSGGMLCSAALINNTADDGTGYLVTAGQCNQTANTIVRFGFERPDCNSGSAPTDQNVSGLVALAEDPVTGSALYQLTSSIPLSFEPAFAGWSRSPANPGLGAILHHPFGGPKSIAIDSNGGGAGLVAISGVGSINCWVLDCQTGGTESGSEGAAMWDQNGHLRGVNVGSPVGSCANSNFGRFHLFYANANLGQWLDPLGLNPETWEAFDAVNPSGVSAPQIATVTPSQVEAIAIDGQSVLVEGAGFNGTTEVRLGGVTLEVLPPQFQVLSDSQVLVQIPPQASLGPVSIEVIDSEGSDTIDLTIVANATPTLELENSEPSFMLTAVPARIYVASQPGDVIFLQASATLAPSILPGVVSLDIGGNFTDLADLGIYVVPGTTGYVLVEAPLPDDLPPGISVYAQAAVFPIANPVLPTLSTNFQTGTVLF